MRVLVLNGPNLNMLGTREVDIYGSETLRDVEDICVEAGARLNLEVICRQSNHEGQLITWIHEALDHFDGIVINPGAYTHTSIAILDALLSVGLPVVEVHLSNVFRREEFRHKSYVSQAAWGIIGGFGSQGYEMALSAFARRLAPPTTLEA